MPCLERAKKYMENKAQISRAWQRNALPFVLSAFHPLTVSGPLP